MEMCIENYPNIFFNGPAFHKYSESHAEWAKTKEWQLSNLVTELSSQSPVESRVEGHMFGKKSS